MLNPQDLPAAVSRNPNQPVYLLRTAELGCNSPAKVIGALVRMPEGATATFYEAVQKDFQSRFDPQQTDLEASKREFADLHRLRSNDCVNGVFYEWELINGGAVYQLYQLPGTSDEQIREAEAALRGNQDVVRLSVLKVAELVDYNPAKEVLLGLHLDQPEECGEFRYRITYRRPDSDVDLASWPWTPTGCYTTETASQKALGDTWNRKPAFQAITTPEMAEGESIHEWHLQSKTDQDEQEATDAIKI